ncbi:hypothetical protein [Cryptosporangium minutisporangium]|uniref:hypothetical protein n=1 Tax=Cryptosporangium minutisporangium TaxID=113569 RepID=UPI0031EEC03E
MKRTLLTIGMLLLIRLTRRRRTGTLIALLGGYYLGRLWDDPSYYARPPLWVRTLDGHYRRHQLF